MDSFSFDDFFSFETFGLIDEIVKNINSLPDFSYLCFDADATLSEFTKHAVEAGIEGLGTRLEKDITDIVLVGLSKGNLHENKFDKFKLLPKPRLQELKHCYKIITKADKGKRIATRNDSMSFARAVIVFPLVALDLIKRGLHKPKLTRNHLFSNELPAVFKNAGFPALIPKRNKAGSVYFHAYLAYDIEVTSRINRNSRKSVMQKFYEQHVYASNPWEGKFIGFEERVEVMKKYELNTREVLETCLKVANKLLSEVGKEIFDTNKIIEKYVDENDVVNFELVDEEHHV